MKFPEKVYTTDEVEKAKKLIDEGYKHELKVEGTPEFKEKVNQSLDLLRTVGYYELLRTYIREITEIDGLTQLRETEAVIWANKFAVENPVDAASLFIQKVNHMKEYLEGKEYYGGQAEKRSVDKRIGFLEKLEKESKNKNIKDECKRLLQMWEDAALAY
ncbi:hypothetical protein JJE00_03255 [Candidatus Bathyarchaeota archaeon]|nr:hypothetical protein [Candidatus Bathyarchaeota archaeon]MCJ7713794.1 hypothetical protein [Candidatus Bathyarchaeota archaeon]